MLLKTLGKKKTESEYEKYIARVACSFFSLGILGLFIVRSNSLHQMYIAAYDERNKQILQLTAVATLVLEFLLIFALIALYAFANIQLPYVTVLSILLYGLVLGFALIRLILSKIR